MRSAFILFVVVINIALAVYIWRYIVSLNEFTAMKERFSVDSKSGIFIPTNEWQPLGRDQPVPANIHVRINLQTGEREAKLLSADSDDDSVNDLAIVPLSDETGQGKDTVDDNHRYVLLKEALKNIPDESDKTKDKSSQKPEKKFRTYEQLKKDMSDLNLTMKTDAEVLQELIENVNKLRAKTEGSNLENDAELLVILNDLEYLLHQVDNAEEFGKRRGFESIILPCLSSNSTEVRTKAALVLGAAVQNNPKVQIAALEAGIIKPLLKNIAGDKYPEVRSSSVFAISCLVRLFPLAEQKLIDDGGLSVLLSIFREESSDSLKLQLKVLTFFNDILMEKDDAALSVKENALPPNSTDETSKKEYALMTEKLRQYSSVGLRVKLADHGWCSILSRLLSDRIMGTRSNDIINHSEINEDALTKVLNAAYTSLSFCETDFVNDKTFYFVIGKLYNYYKQLSPKDYTDYYDEDILKLLKELCTRLNLV